MRIIGISRIPGGVDMHMEITNDSFVMEKENLPYRVSIGIANCKLCWFERKYITVTVKDRFTRTTVVVTEITSSEKMECTLKIIFVLIYLRMLENAVNNT